MFLGNNLISWSFKKQRIVFCSSAESEYKTLALVTLEIFWLTCLFQELRISLVHIPILYRGNKNAEP